MPVLEQQFVDKLATNFVEGLFWVYTYYYYGVDNSSWSWYFPHHFAPLLVRTIFLPFFLFFFCVFLSFLPFFVFLSVFVFFFFWFVIPKILFQFLILKFFWPNFCPIFTHFGFFFTIFNFAFVEHFCFFFLFFFSQTFVFFFFFCAEEKIFAHFFVHPFFFFSVTCTKCSRRPWRAKHQSIWTRVSPWGPWSNFWLFCRLTAWRFCQRPSDLSLPLLVRFVSYFAFSFFKTIFEKIKQNQNQNSKKKKQK